jgi:protein disulfide-isomerase
MPSPVQAPVANAMAGTANPWVTPDASAPRMPIAEQRASFNASPGGDFPLPSAPAPSYANQPNSGPFQAPAAPSPGPAFAPSAAVLGPPTSGVALSPPALPAARPGIASSPPSLPAAPPALAAAPPAPPTTPPTSPAAQRQPVALDGYCPVTLVEREKWVKGDPKWGALHRGRTYLFAGPDEQRRFLENQAFEKYAPALSGYDAVKYAEQGTMIDGKRSHGVFYRGQVFLFADEAALQQFWTAPDRYAGVVRAEQQQSAMRSSLQR